MFDVGEYFGCGFRKPGDLPDLDRVDELFIQAVFRLIVVIVLLLGSDQAKMLIF